MRKLVLLFAAINCAAIYADTSSANLPTLEERKAAFMQQYTIIREQMFGTDEENLAIYEELLEKDYRLALATQLCGQSQAIADKFKEHKNNNIAEEQTKISFYDDGKPGWNATPTTQDCVKGFLLALEAGYRKKQDEANDDYQKEFNEYRANFNNNVKPLMHKKLADRIYMLSEHYIVGLDECGNDQACLYKHHVIWNNITKEGALDKECSLMYDDVHKKVTENGIPLTREQTIAIAATIKPTASQDIPLELKDKTLVEQIALAKEKVQKRVHDILNPEERKVKIDFDADERNDQSNQSIFSQ